MQPTSAQKGVKVLSILAIIFGILAILVGILAVAGGALIAGDPEASADIAQSTGISPANAGLAASLGGVVIMIAAGLEVLMGILGLGAAKDNQRIMPVWVLALISLIMSVVSVIMNVLNGVEASQMFSLVTGLVISALFFWFANTVKKEAGK